MTGELSQCERLCPRLEREAAIVEPGEHFIVPHRIDGERAAAIAADKIKRSILRPADIAGATIAAPHLAYVPFWRVDVAVDGMHVSFPITISGRNGRPGIPVPLPGFRHRESVSLVIARKLFPFPPSHVERTRGRVLGGSTTYGGWHGVEIQLEEMVPFAGHDANALALAEIVEPDVSRAEAEHVAGKRAQHNARPDGAIYARYQPEVRSAACVHHPLYIVRYSYRGHAARDPGETFWVTVCGRHGKVVGGHHPSVIRSVAHKLRKLVTFDV